MIRDNLDSRPTLYATCWETCQNLGSIELKFLIHGRVSIEIHVHDRYYSMENACGMACVLRDNCATPVLGTGPELNVRLKTVPLTNYNYGTPNYEENPAQLDSPTCLGA